MKVVNDLFPSNNKGNMSMKAWPDFSSAFDTTDLTVHVDHTELGFTDTVFILSD